MKRIQSIVALLLAVLMCIGSFAFAEGAGPVYQLGGKIDDFTVTTWDGQTVTLSELLKEKKMVLINVWATWCGPCRSEFPFMEEAYKQYSDDIAIVALSCEPTDTDDVLAAFVAEMGLTFYVAQDTVDMAGKLYATAIPTTVVVDRFGNIAFWHVSSVPDTASFTRLFDYFVADDYVATDVLFDIPAMKPNVAPVAEADLAAALGTDNAANPTGEYDWPMMVAEKDGRTVVTAPTSTYGSTTATVSTTLTAKAGDAIAITFKTSTEAFCDLMYININGKNVKVFGGEKDWTTFAIPVEADGDYTVALSYVKDVMADEGEDNIWIDTVAVATGDAAAAALAANPVYPVAEANTLVAVSEGAKEVVISDDNGMLAASFGDSQYYIAGGDTITYCATLTKAVDPDAAFFYCDFDGAYTGMADVMTEDGYVITVGVDSMELTGYPYTSIQLFLDAQGNNVLYSVFFKDEANLNAFVAGYELGTWQYADGTLPTTDAQPEAAADIPSAATYTIKYVDQDGNPVAGVMCQVCDAETCQVYTSDENGVVAFQSYPYAWEIHTLKVPAGYEGDTETVTLAPAEGGELVFTLTKL